MSIYDTLNKEQKEAVLHTEGPLLLLAGAGSGKTRVLTHRVAYLIDEMGVNPWNILAITFTNKAAQEMRERVDQIAGFGADQVWVATFHATCMRILRRHIDRLGYDTNFTIYDTDDQKSVIKQVCKRLNIDTKMYKERTLLSEISSAKDELVDVREFEVKSVGDYKKSVIAKVYREYQETLKKSNALDFDDIIVKTVELFKSCPEVLYNYQERFKYIMVDEYQDTNTAQFELIRLLADGYRNLCVVGDDDQSIYRFRGAKPEIMLGFEKDYPQARRTLLGINYRSTSNIVDDAGKLIRHNKTRFDKEIRAARGAGKPVVTAGFADAQAETRKIVKEIQDYVQMGYPYSDIAVLYRTNLEPRLLMERLMEYNIPFQMRDALPNIYEHWITQDLLTYIRMAADPLAEQHQAKRADALRIINRPKRYISREALDGAVISWDSVKSWYRAKDWMVERIEDLEYDLKILKKLAPVAAVNYIRKAIGYDEYLTDYAEYRRMKPEELFELADQIQESASGYKTMEAWLLHMEEYGEQLKQQAQNLGERDLNCVALMTMHSSKGLEFPVVYIMDANERVTPHHKAVLEADLEEERRMFYVAMTRAKDRLHVYYTKERYGKPQERSRFIDEYLYPDGAPPGEFRPGPQQNGAAGSYNRKAVR